MHISRLALATALASTLMLQATLLAPTIRAAGTVWQYPGGGPVVVGTNPCPPGDLQTCISSADVSDGDVIEIAQGVYNESFTLHKTLSLIGKDSGATFQALTNQRVATITASAAGTIRLSNLTFARGRATGKGGGIWADTPLPLLLNNVVITGNTALGTAAGEGLGGGLYARGQVVANTSLFGNNRAAVEGGGLYGFEQVTLNESTLVSNTALTGGGVYAVDRLTLNNSRLTLNAASGNGAGAGSGGGAYANKGVTVRGGALISNTAIRSGGGMQISLQNNAPESTVTGLTVENNRATGSGSNAGFGAGLALQLQGRIKIQDSVFRGNAAVNDGGALSSQLSRAQIERSRFFDNSSRTNGGAILLAQFSTLQLTNTVLARNVGASDIVLTGDSNLYAQHNTFAGPGAGAAVSATIGSIGVAVLTNSIISTYSIGINGPVSVNGVLWNSVGVQSQGAGASVSNGVSGAPAFVNPAGDDYHIGKTSAARDAGVVSNIATDIDGEARPINSGYDLGADEYNAMRPVANAGPDQNDVVLGSLVTLDGRASVNPLPYLPMTYAWTQISGPAVTLSSASAVTPTFTTPVDTTPYTVRFSLIVTVDGESSLPDTVDITVINRRPVADAGPDQNVPAGAMVQLNGSGSSDPDGHAISYAWSQVSGPPVTLSNPNSVNPSFTAPGTAAVIELQLNVTDQYGLVSATADTVFIAVGGAVVPTATPTPTPTATPTATPAGTQPPPTATSTPPGGSPTLTPTPGNPTQMPSATPTSTPQRGSGSVYLPYVRRSR